MKSGQSNFEPFAQLEWLADFFACHSQEKVAQDAFRQLLKIRKEAERTLANSSTSNVVQLFKGPDANPGD